MLRNKPRAHHYIFAHEALRILCERDLFSLFEVAGTDEQADLLDFIWLRVCEHCDQEEEADFSAADIRLEVREVDGVPIILVEMPPAKAVAEAIFIGIVLKAEQGAAEYRYFVLEQGVPVDDASGTMFCEWRLGNHYNLGEGCEPELEAFVELLKTKIQ